MKKMEDLRETLFTTLEGVVNGSITPEKAASIVSVADCLIDSVKVEVDLVKAIGAMSGSSFIELPNKS